LDLISEANQVIHLSLLLLLEFFDCFVACVNPLIVVLDESDDSGNLVLLLLGCLLGQANCLATVWTFDLLVEGCNSAGLQRVTSQAHGMSACQRELSGFLAVFVADYAFPGICGLFRCRWGGRGDFLGDFGVFHALLRSPQPAKKGFKF
jgi:hypothetical protein